MAPGKIKTSNIGEKSQNIPEYLKPAYEQTANHCRAESIIPANFRLCKKLNGELVLQGCFQWVDSIAAGFEWRDLETIEEDNSNE